MYFWCEYGPVATVLRHLTTCCLSFLTAPLRWGRTFLSGSQAEKPGLCLHHQLAARLSLFSAPGSPVAEVSGRDAWDICLISVPVHTSSMVWMHVSTLNPHASPGSPSLAFTKWLSKDSPLLGWHPNPLLLRQCPPPHNIMCALSPGRAKRSSIAVYHLLCGGTIPGTCPMRIELFSPNQIWGIIADVQYTVPRAALEYAGCMISDVLWIINWRTKNGSKLQPPDSRREHCH